MSFFKSNFASQIIKTTKKLVTLFLLISLLISRGDYSSDSSSFFSKVTKSGIQKKAESFMNTKSDLLKECTDLQSKYPNDKIQLHLSKWNSTPIETIYHRDIYQLEIEKAEAYKHYGWQNVVQKIKARTDWDDVY